ncbi:hypothetical protein [Streptomyces axinellae]|jgi:hypothetical protein|uniref:PknH-like extracellular domain-containing protein n=1 Tax=Streptomyces axinellae TaxID=552788 RepID=A0ABP6D378_9ACTN
MRHTSRHTSTRTLTARRAAAGATAVTAALALALLTAGPATAAPAPGFLKPGDLPPHPSSAWYAGKVTKGLPDPETFCLEGAIPAGNGTYHRSFRTDLDAGAEQVGVTTASPTEAGKLAARLESRVADCAADWLRANPGASASWADYGKVAAGDSAHVYGVHTAPPESEHGVSLFAVVRKGAKVTAVRWSAMGTLTDAPVSPFRTTAEQAATRL